MQNTKVLQVKYIKLKSFKFEYFSHAISQQMIVIKESRVYGDLIFILIRYIG